MSSLLQTYHSIQSILGLDPNAHYLTSFTYLQSCSSPINFQNNLSNPYSQDSTIFVSTTMLDDQVKVKTWVLILGSYIQNIRREPRKWTSATFFLLFKTMYKVPTVHYTLRTEPVGGRAVVPGPLREKSRCQDTLQIGWWGKAAYRKWLIHADSLLNIPVPATNVSQKAPRNSLEEPN